ncbi:MAG TPA: LptF/LptG family permease [Pyrinomonadaceae bacterium]|jgi:lipopolysaccharide export LptBFGC system permease protein LptF
MKKFSWLISKYLIQAILPYFVFSWLLLSVVIFFQQASRFSEIFFSTSIPKNLIWQLTLALVPNVVAFTCPMAVLVGVIIGLSKMQGDSELTAVRAAGVGNLQITLPIVVLGILLSFFAFFVNLKGVPFAAQIVRGVALQTALYKLESPIEPGVFNTEISGYTIYVKNGDLEKGAWQNIFIYAEDKPNKQVRLITSKNGRIDSTNDLSELVLESAVVSTFSTENDIDKFVSENVGQIRLGIKTKRGELIEKISGSDKSLEELGLNELAKYAQNTKGNEKTEAELLLQRRLILSVTPLIFALLGTALVIRFNRGGRGFGIFLALLCLVLYYLITLLGEQLARTGTISVLSASLLPLILSSMTIIWLFLSSKVYASRSIFDIKKYVNLQFRKKENRVSKGNFYIDFTTGILDFDIVSNLLKYFLLTLGFLTSIFLIFTAFELWKFAGTSENGVTLLAKYLFYLLPFIYIQIAPSALMVAILATFIIKSRQNEIVTWTSAGQSVYRLLLPCFVLMLVMGVVNWAIQEKLLPGANQTQDNLRAQIRSTGFLANKDGKLWVANDERIYSFEKAEGSTKDSQKIKNLSIYEFCEDGSRLAGVYKAPEAVWEKDKVRLGEKAQKFVWNDGKAQILDFSGNELPEKSNLFINLYKKPTHLDAAETREQIQISRSEIEQRNYEVALEKKYTTLVLPFVITLFTTPFALSLSRKGRVITVGYAIGIWLLFMGLTSTFEQFGLNGVISAKIAVWSPLLLFSMIGLFLISKVKT